MTDHEIKLAMLAAAVRGDHDLVSLGKRALGKRPGTGDAAAREQFVARATWTGEESSGR